MRIDVLTIFPEMLVQSLSYSILGRAQQKGLVSFNAVDIRNFAFNKHRAVDDYPYGGGQGMVMQAEPIFLAAEKVLEEAGGKEGTKIILLSPQGSLFTQAKAWELSRLSHLVLICGHYEGVDERVREFLADEDLSIGDYVLTGGEIPALVVIDAVVRLLPGVLGSPASACDDSFSRGILEYPQYTRPYDFRGYKVPDILLSGNHAEIAKWRRKQSLLRTYMKRPDLLAKIKLSSEDEKLLAEALAESDA
ncbi:MAG: tRNA (guanosine(37)-N1)-methyltransferase TrmD [Clostridia bacterium]|nr:tRNA (guanosine(37)-N1)-methyltransferase TrmD [Clostridia bacterium]